MHEQCTGQVGGNQSPQNFSSPSRSPGESQYRRSRHPLLAADERQFWHTDDGTDDRYIGRLLQNKRWVLPALMLHPKRTAATAAEIASYQGMAVRTVERTLARLKAQGYWTLARTVIVRDRSGRRIFCKERILRSLHPEKLRPANVAATEARCGGDVSSQEFKNPRKDLFSGGGDKSSVSLRTRKEQKPDDDRRRREIKGFDLERLRKEILATFNGRASLEVLNAEFDRIVLRIRDRRTRLSSPRAYIGQALENAIEEQKQKAAEEAAEKKQLAKSDACLLRQINRQTELPKPQSVFSRCEICAHIFGRAVAFRLAADRTDGELSSDLRWAAGKAFRIMQSLPGNPDPEATEKELSALDTQTFEVLRCHAGEQTLTAIAREMEKSLASYSRRMTPDGLRLIQAQYLQTRLREIFHVPRISLFYME
jgi:DNA-binding transcriptional ArsR family regulator